MADSKRNPPIRIAALTMDAVIVGMAHAATFLLMARPPVDYAQWSLMTLAVVAVAFGITFARGAHRIQARHLGRADILNLGVMSVLVAIACLVLQLILQIGADEISLSRIPIGTGAISFVFLVTARLIQGREGGNDQIEVEPRPTLIVGAGDAGELIYRELSRVRSSGYQIVGFVDDDLKKVQTTIHGVPVLGTIDDIPRLCESYEIDEILIAIPSASGETNRRIFHACAQTEARVQNLPSIAMRVFSEKPIVPLMREFQVEDLLRRAPIQADMNPARGYLGGERVMVTGGGGSIGSELARQVAALNPAQLILIGKGENSIFEIDRELRESGVARPTAIICDVRDPQGLDLAMRTHTPRVVFHAAAHKHVPLMESTPIEAVRNNVFGTLNVAEACIRHGVGKFILVSTDKAVNPGNIMGASKRVAEMIVQALAGRSDTGFAIVRFGNVLGSRGSLIPILRSQIDKGGPVTVT
ncbi:MAG: polysaccharide biosynthesis protein, partial [Fimbriimonadaceae bacterium]|nr:polysaccharide biosynthesis protein [Fimbriimonadaceae bacterium]